MKINALGGNYSVGAGVNTRKLVNCYLERNEEGGDGDNGYIVRPTFGTNFEHNFGDVNGAINLFFVPVGNDTDTLYSFRVAYSGSGWTLYRNYWYAATGFDNTSLQTAGAPNNFDLYYDPLSFTGNNEYQLIVPSSGPIAVLDVIANTYTALSLPVPPEVISGKAVAFVNSRWFVLGNDGNIYWSELNAPSGFTAINYISTQSGTNPTAMIVENNTDLLVFCNEHWETFVPSDSIEAPMERQINLTGKVGANDTQLSKSVLDIYGVIFWIGQSQNRQNVVYRKHGNQVERVSNEWIESLINPPVPYDEGSIQSYDECYSYEYRAHQFYCIPLTNTNTCLVYDLKTGLWHEREDPQKIRSIKNNYVLMEYYATSFMQKIDFAAPYFNSNQSPYIYRSIEMEPVFDPNNYNRLFHYEMRVKSAGEMVADNPIYPYDMVSPLMTLEISNDGGKTFPIVRTSTRNIDGFNRFTMLGSARKRVYRLSWNNPGYNNLTGVTSPNMKVGDK